MAFLCHTGQEVFYGTVSPIKGPRTFSWVVACCLVSTGTGSWSSVSPGRIACSLGWIYQLGADTPLHLVICDDHRKPYISKCQAGTCQSLQLNKYSRLYLASAVSPAWRIQEGFNRRQNHSRGSHTHTYSIYIYIFYRHKLPLWSHSGAFRLSILVLRAAPT